METTAKFTIDGVNYTLDFTKPNAFHDFYIGKDDGTTEIQVGDMSPEESLKPYTGLDGLLDYAWTNASGHSISKRELYSRYTGENKNLREKYQDIFNQYIKKAYDIFKSQ